MRVIVFGYSVNGPWLLLWKCPLYHECPCTKILLNYSLVNVNFSLYSINCLLVPTPRNCRNKSACLTLSLVTLDILGRFGRRERPKTLFNSIQKSPKATIKQETPLFLHQLTTWFNLVPRVNRPLRETPLSIFDPGIGLVYSQFDWLFKQ